MPRRDVTDVLCDTTLTPRVQGIECDCGTYADNLGPCRTFEAGSEDRCVYCDHGLSCHNRIPKE